MGEEKRLSAPQIRRDLFRKDLRHFCIRQGEKNDVALLNRFRRFHNPKFVRSRRRPRLTTAVQSNDDLEPVVPKIQGVSMALRAKSDHAANFAAQWFEADMFVAINLHRHRRTKWLKRPLPPNSI
jgi:hypothetical protein